MSWLKRAMCFLVRVVALRPPRPAHPHADFGGASRAEMEGWVAEEWVYGELQGAAQPGGTLCRGLALWLGGWRL